MPWRLESVLGYRYTHYLELKNVGGSTVYHMVFATDNDTGNKIMRDVYAEAARRIPAMRADALEHRRQITVARERRPAARPRPWPRDTHRQ
jgi:hypothetical protein